MERDLCLKPFIAYDVIDVNGLGNGLGNSCWIDSLFVALFHNNTTSIQTFIENLKYREYNNSNKEQLETYNKNIIQYIKEQYMIIKESIETPSTKNKKILICRRIRELLENHKKLLVGKHPGINNYHSFKTSNSPIDLITYLKTYILDYNSFNNIIIRNITRKKIIDFQSKTLEHIINDSVVEEYNKLLSDIPIEEKYKDINFLDIINYKSEDFKFLKNQIKENLFENILYLNSIIVHDGIHYMCYYKCNGQWYFYNDLRQDPNIRTELIGSLNDVFNHHNANIISKSQNIDLNLTLLYLKRNNLQEITIIPSQIKEDKRKTQLRVELNNLEQMLKRYFKIIKIKQEE